MPVSSIARRPMVEKLHALYGAGAEDVMRRIDALADRYAALRHRAARPSIGPHTVFLITYGDQIVRDGRASLEVLGDFLQEYGLDELLSGVHILPCFPYTSDDGFSVVDYRQIDPSLGGWPDVRRLGDSFDLVLDLVINHCSQRHAWFQAYLRGQAPFTHYFIEVDPAADLSQVVRPRSLPLLTPFATTRGQKHLWTTFSADQIDLNFAEPDVLVEMLDVLLFYIQEGARVVRLDAVGFLWKEIGTTSINLPQTHTVVKLMRDLIDDVAPGTMLLSETNVPHRQNVSYFGLGDEAHAVYNFSLAPLLLDAFLNEDAEPICRWLSALDYPGEGMTFFNFTASHDGIGVRPLEGLVSQERFEHLVSEVRRRGGLVSTRKAPGGGDIPYELNVSYLSALDEPGGLAPEAHARRFLTSQGVMLAMRGIPGVYFHSLVGTRNDADGVRRTGRNRSINHRKFSESELRAILDCEGSVERLVLDGYRKMLSVRVRQPAFHPDAAQRVIGTGHHALIALERTSREGQRIWVLANVGSTPVRVELPAEGDLPLRQELLSGRRVEDRRYEVAPYALAWLASDG